MVWMVWNFLHFLHLYIFLLCLWTRDWVQHDLIYFLNSPTTVRYLREFSFVTDSLMYFTSLFICFLHFMYIILLWSKTCIFPFLFLTFSCYQKEIIFFIHFRTSSCRTKPECDNNDAAALYWVLEVLEKTLVLFFIFIIDLGVTLEVLLPFLCISYLSFEILHQSEWRWCFLCCLLIFLLFSHILGAHDFWKWRVGEGKAEIHYTLTVFLSKWW